VQQSSQLLEPSFDARLALICSGHVSTMAGVLVKAGLAGDGKAQGDLWVDQQFEQLGLQPSKALTNEMACVRERRGADRFFQGDPEVAIDTNPIERALGPIPARRNSWLFC